MKLKSPPVVGDIVSCTWLDAHASVTDTYAPEEVGQVKSYKFTTYGILVRDDRGLEVNDPLVGVAAEVGDDRRYRGVTYVPASLVIDLKVVKAAQRKARTPPDTPHKPSQ